MASTGKLDYQYPKERLEEAKRWFLKRLGENGSKIEKEDFARLEVKQEFLSSIWFHFSTAWANWCRLVHDKAEEDQGKLRGISFPLLSAPRDEEYRRDFPYYNADSSGFGPSITTQKRFFEIALRNEKFPLLDPFVLKPYLESLIIYYAFIASEMPQSLTSRIDSAFIQISWQAGYYTRAINEELAKWERTDSSNIVRQTEAEKRREAMKAFVFGNPRLTKMSKRSLSEYIYKNFPWGEIKRVTVSQLRKDLTKLL